MGLRYISHDEQTHKHTTQYTSEIVTNFDEFRTVLADTRFEHYID